MSDHATPAVLEPHPEPQHGDGGEPDHAATHPLRFEKTELQYFTEDDQYAGSNIGKLLAATFFILVAMMAGVAYWTSQNQFQSQDPFEADTSAPAIGGH